MGEHDSAAVAGAHGHDEEFHEDIIYPDAVPFLGVHLACLAAIWTGVGKSALILCGVLYLVRMFAVTAGYHRYFSHRTYRTSRTGQFVMAWLCQSTLQKSVLWWAAKHRHHHKHADTENDVHSPRHRGFWYSHLGWVFSRRNDETPHEAVPDLARYPELVWLDRYQKVPAFTLALLCWLIAGWQGLVVGFFWSTVLLYHATFAINSLAHVVGTQRYVTGDDSRNNWWLAVITLGEGWHNNHHFYMTSTRQGFRWWEVDPTYYLLKVLSWTGVVWDLRDPPPEVVRNERRLGRGVVEKVARQLAATFPVEALSAQAHDALSRTPSWKELQERARAARRDAEAYVAQLHLPHVPTLEEVRLRAQEAYAQSPSMDDIAERTRQILLESVSAAVVRRMQGPGQA
jgi:stearoyl-CoA desaturase (Delta-9 desaturase)